MQTYALPDGGTLTYLERSDWDNSGADRRGHRVPAGQFIGLAVHHTVALVDDTPGFADEIAHMCWLRTCRPDLGLDVPYSFVVFAQTDPRDVVVAEGRGPGRTGAHTKGHNSTRYGCAFAGNAETEAVTPGVVAGFRWIGSQFVGPTATAKTFGHLDIKATACPGRNLYAVLDRLQPPFADPTIERPPTMGTTPPSPDDVVARLDAIDAKLDEIGAVVAYSTDPGDLLDRVYLRILGRRPDRVGKAHWLKHLDGGGSFANLVSTFLLSPERKQRES